jgi:hypothetical protein
MNRDVARLIGWHCDLESLVALSQVCRACHRGLGEDWEAWGRFAAYLADKEPRVNEVLTAGMQLQCAPTRSKRGYCLAGLAALRRRLQSGTLAPLRMEPVSVAVMGERRQRFCALFDGCTWSQMPTLYDAREYTIAHWVKGVSVPLVLRDTFRPMGYQCTLEWSLLVQGIAPPQHVFVALVDTDAGSRKAVAERIADVRDKCPKTQFLVSGIGGYQPVASEWPDCAIGPQWVSEETSTAVAVLLRAVELETAKDM